MSQTNQNYQEPLIGRESLFRQKLSQLRNTGEIQRNIRNSCKAGFKTIEQNHYLDNASISVQRNDLHKLENLALLDTLTELYNHHMLCRMLKDELRRARRYQNFLSLLAVTVDIIPELTEKAGNQTTDNILRAVAQFLMKSVRDVDIPARYDFNRFVILCPETNIDGALSLCGRLVSNTEKEDFSATGCNRRITLSIGMATFPELAENDEQLLHLSMQALTVARRAGGNTFKIGGGI